MVYSFIIWAYVEFKKRASSLVCMYLCVYSILYMWSFYKVLVYMTHVYIHEHFSWVCMGVCVFKRMCVVADQRRVFSCN